MYSEETASNPQSVDSAAPSIRNSGVDLKNDRSSLKGTPTKSFEILYGNVTSLSLKAKSYVFASKRSGFDRTLQL